MEQLSGSGIDEAIRAQQDAVLAAWVDAVEVGSRGRATNSMRARSQECYPVKKY